MNDEATLFHLNRRLDSFQKTLESLDTRMGILTEALLDHSAAVAKIPELKARIGLVQSMCPQCQGTPPGGNSGGE